MQAEIKGALDVAENALDQVHVKFSGHMHVHTRLLNHMCDVWTGQGEIPQSTCVTLMLRGIGKKRAILSGELAHSVDRGGRRVTFNHACAL